ncbi:hypothetical protein SO802_004178 [Lithocarpus litseifolius]|uniref:Endonuclease/exonuclease/phosphatase domain-containing protein n=1 Tax=Lithocarpus litseifolius TaxID=425828 RepID=A0AAW2E666_9ROSI
MNILVWNCRGALNPSFQSFVNNLTLTHCPTIMIITETKVSGSRAKEITDRLRLDGGNTCQQYRVYRWSMGPLGFNPSRCLFSFIHRTRDSRDSEGPLSKLILAYVRGLCEPKIC